MEESPAGPDSSNPVESLFEKFFERVDAGEEVDIDALCRQHPTHAAELRRIHFVWSQFRALHTSPSSRLVRRLAAHGSKETRYRFEGEIARGGMGAILKVWDEDLRRHLAMKVVLGKGVSATSGATPAPTSRQIARFLEEAQVTGQLDHPGIVPVHELGLDADGRIYFTMRLVKGRDLKSILDLAFAGAEGWSETRALGVLLKVCEAMSYAHAKGVIHRDLKPANVMVGRFGEVYVMDWGLSRVLDRAETHDLRILPADLAATQSVATERREEREDTPDSPLITMDGDVVGTPAYMAPEQARGEIDRLTARSDVYSIGAMLYHLLARQVPFMPPGARISHHTILMRVIEGPPRRLRELRPDIPAELEAICEKAMERDAGARYTDTLEFAEDLRAYLEGRVVRAYETGAWAEARKWVVRNKLLATAAAAAMLFLAVGMAVSLRMYRRAETKSHESEDNALRAIEARNEAVRRSKEARWQAYAMCVQAAATALQSNEPATTRRKLEAAPEEFRNWEWRHLQTLQDSSLMVIRGSNDVTTVSFSRDGQRLLVGHRDGTTKLIRAADGTEIGVIPAPLPPSDSALGAAFSADESKILISELRPGDFISGPDNGPGYTARVWDTATWSAVTTIRGGHYSGALLSPSATRLITFGDSAPSARLWEAGSGALLGELTGHEDRVCCAAFSPDGLRVVTGSDDRTARVWDAERRTELFALRGHLGEVKALAFSSDGSRIATVAGYSVDDSTARIWDASTGKQIAVLQGSDNFNHLAFSPNGAQLMTFSDSAWLDGSESEGVAYIWDVASGVMLGALKGHGHRIVAASFSPDGSRIATASADKTVRIWDATTRSEFVVLRGHESPLASLSFSPDGLRVAAAAGNAVRIWRVDAPVGVTCLRAIGAKDPPAAFSPDGLLVATGSTNAGSDISGEGDNSAHLWDAVTGVEVAVLRGHGRPIMSVSFSPDGSRIVTGSQEGELRIWDCTTGVQVAPPSACNGRGVHVGPKGVGLISMKGFRGVAELFSLADGSSITTLRGDEMDVTSAAFSPDGMHIVTGCNDNTARVMDASTGSKQQILRGHDGPVTAVAYSPDGSRLVTGSTDRTARLWDVSTGEQLAVLPGHDSVVEFVTFSPDGSRVLTSTTSATYSWKYAGGISQLAVFRGHDGDDVHAASYSPDGSRVITASYIENLTRVWDPETGEQLLALRGGVTAEFSPDGSQILTGSNDGAAYVYDSIPWSRRGSESKRTAAQESRVREVLRALESTCPSLFDAAQRLRGDSTLDPQTRHSALVAISQLTREATAWIHDLSGQLILRDDILAVIQADASRRPWVREMAQRFAIAMEDDQSGIEEAIWTIVRSAGRSADEYASAYHAAQGALSQNPYCGRTLGAAQYRVGRYSEALTSISHFVELMGKEEPLDMAFLALSHFKLGEVGDALPLLTRLKARILEEEWRLDADSKSMLAEAEAVIEHK